MAQIDLVPKYLSENWQPGDTFVLRKKFYSLAEAGETVTLINVEACSSSRATSGGFYQEGLVFLFITPEGLKMVEAPKFGTFDHTFLVLLAAPTVRE